MAIGSLANTQYSKFVEFATGQMQSGNSKAVARFGAEGPLGNRTLKAADPRQDWVGHVRRNDSEKTLNDSVRTSFRNAIADMFGGMDHVPESVKKMMCLDDYGQGKPLTKANRLAFYGGRFLESAENFKAGMELLDSFRDWYGDLNRFVHDNNKGKHFADAKTLTHLNVEYKVADKVNAHGQPGLEAMIFQDIAADRKFDLRKRGEDVFGFANNAAMRYFGRNCQNSIFGTVFNVPPAKRRVLFAANDALTPLIKDANTAALFENNKKGI